MTDLSEGMWNLALQPQQTSYLHYHSAYGHQFENLSWWLILRGSKPLIQITLWSRGLARSRDKWKPLYLYESGYSHQIWKNGNLLWRLMLKGIWPFDHVVLWDHVTN